MGGIWKGKGRGDVWVWGGYAMKGHLVSPMCSCWLLWWWWARGERVPPPAFCLWLLSQCLNTLSPLSGLPAPRPQVSSLCGPPSYLTQQSSVSMSLSAPPLPVPVHTLQRTELWVGVEVGPGISLGSPVGVFRCPLTTRSPYLTLGNVHGLDLWL